MSESINTQDTDIAISYKKGWEVAVGRLEEFDTCVIQLASLNPMFEGTSIIWAQKAQVNHRIDWSAMSDLDLYSL